MSQQDSQSKGGIMKNKGGRPAKFKTPEEMQAAIDEYFLDCPDTYDVIVGGEIGMVTVPCPTLTGLALYLGFCDRYSMYDYEEREEFSHTIKRARAIMVRIYESEVRFGRNTAGAIFMLKNFGYSDKQELEVSQKEVTPEMIEEFEQKLLRQ
jgi:hypothetical protein